MDSQIYRREIEEARDLDDLEARLKVLGEDFQSRRELIAFAEQQWKRYFSEHLESELVSPFYPDPLEDLPATRVNVDGIDVYVHGIAHGNPNVEMGSLQDRPKDFIYACAKRYKNKPNSDYVLEDGMSKLLGLNPEKQLKDTMVMLNNPLSLIMVMGFVRFPLMIAKALDLVPGESEEVYSRVAFKNLMRSLKDERYLPNAKFAHDNHDHLPPRLKIEADALGGPEWFMSKYCKFRVARSYVMAREIVKRAKEKELNEIHAIIGMGHENEVAYFLQNPRYLPTEIEKLVEVEELVESLRSFETVEKYARVALSKENRQKLDNILGSDDSKKFWEFFDSEYRIRFENDPKDDAAKVGLKQMVIGEALGLLSGGTAFAISVGITPDYFVLPYVAGTVIGLGFYCAVRIVSETLLEEKPQFSIGKKRFVNNLRTMLKDSGTWEKYEAFKEGRYVPFSES